MNEKTKEILEAINEIGGEANQTTRRIGILINKKLDAMPDDEKKAIMKEVKEADGLKLNPQTVYQSYLMVKKFQEMMNEDWVPRENLSVSHYFELSKEAFSTGTLANFIEQASANSWSVRNMRAEVKATKEETLSEDETIRKGLFKDINKILKGRSNNELNSIKEVLSNEYEKTKTG